MQILKKERSLFIRSSVFADLRTFFGSFKQQFRILIKKTNQSFIYDLVTFYNQSLKHHKNHMLLIKWHKYLLPERDMILQPIILITKLKKKEANNCLLQRVVIKIIAFKSVWNVSVSFTSTNLQNRKYFSLKIQVALLNMQVQHLQIK